MATILLAFSFKAFAKGLLITLFILTALLLTLVVLLQEPKGGGLSSAFGGAGAESFGVQSGGVNKFTAYTAGVFMFLAILYAAIPEDEPTPISDAARTPASAPEEPGEGVGPPPGDTGGDGTGTSGE